MRRVWVPRETDDEQHRQLDLFIWGDALAGAQEMAKRVFMQMICGGAFEIPSVTELTATGVPFMEAVRQHGSTIDQMKAQQRWLLEDEPYRHAAEAALKGTTLSWDQTRQLIWERDGGVCQVCGDSIAWQQYECGHIIDRCVGGADRLSNLVCMCIVCNRLKPLTETRAEYIAWARQGGPAMKMAKNVVEALKKEGKLAEVMEAFGSYLTLETQ
jgi:5-methylcytosine-specific restriction endonuclease McrA